jgi:hypothetical protein
MKRYVFQITIEEGNDEFWEGVEKDPGQGVIDLHTMITECLASTGLDDAEIRLIEYTDK